MNEVDVVLSVSIGITVWLPGSTVLDLIRLADEAMYRAKQRGGGSVELAPVTPSPMRRGLGQGHLRVV